MAAVGSRYWLSNRREVAQPRCNRAARKQIHPQADFQISDLSSLPPRYCRDRCLCLTKVAAPGPTNVWPNDASTKPMPPACACGSAADYPWMLALAAICGLGNTRRICSPAFGRPGCDCAFRRRLHRSASSLTAVGEAQPLARSRCDSNSHLVRARSILRFQGPVNPEPRAAPVRDDTESRSESNSRRRHNAASVLAVCERI